MSFLEEMRKLALYIKIEGETKPGGEIDIDSLIRTLHAIHNSFKAYTEVQFTRIYQQPNVKKFQSELSKIQKENSLIVVELGFENFSSIGIAPNMRRPAIKFPYLSDIIQWKKETFQGFRKEVIAADYSSVSFLKKIEKKYSAVERNMIYKPIVDDIIKNKHLQFRFGKSKGNYTHKMKALKDTQHERILIPFQNEKREETIQVYRTVERNPKLPGGRGTKVKQSRSVESSIHPYIINHVNYDGVTLTFSSKLKSKVEFDKDDGVFIIKNDSLNIRVWGQTRLQAEEAFQFMVLNLYSTVAREKDKKLTKEAIQIKNSLLNLIKPLSK